MAKAGKGRKRKTSNRKAARQRKRQRAQDMLQGDSPDRPESRSSDEGEGDIRMNRRILLWM